MKKICSMFLAPCHDTNCNVGMSQTVSNQLSPRTTVRERWTLHVNAIRGVVVSGVDGAMSGETVACHEDDDQILVCALSLKHLFSDYVVLHSKTQVRSDPMLDVLYQRPWHRCQYLAMHFRGAIERGQTHSNRRLLVGTVVIRRHRLVDVCVDLNVLTQVSTMSVCCWLPP